MTEVTTLEFFAVLAIIGVFIGVGVFFGRIAKSKGYSVGTWTAACIIISLPAWLLVIALPNKKQHKEIMTALNQIAGLPEYVDEVEDENEDSKIIKSL